MNKNNKKTIVGFTPHEGQKRILDDIVEKFNDYELTGQKSNYVLSLGRSWGKTTSIINLSCFISINYKNQDILYISPTFKLAKTVFREFIQNVENAEFIKNINKTDLEILFYNNSLISFGSAENPNAYRGNNKHTVVIFDEAAFMDSVIWTDVLQPAMNTRGRLCIFISTPNGKNWFYDLHLKAKNNLKNWYYFEGKSEDAPHVKLTEIEEVKINSPLQYRIEYCAEFMDDDLNVFRNIEECSIDIPDFGIPRKNEKIILGIDLGRKQDWTVCLAIDSNNEVRDVYRIKDTNWDLILPKIEDFYKKWNPVGGFAEINYNDRIIDELINKRGCKNLKPLFVEYTKKTKMVQNLQLIFDSKKIKLPKKSEHFQNTVALHNELKQYQALYNLKTGRTKYGAPRGSHDDCVSALLQAFFALSEQNIISKGIIWDTI